MNNKIITREAFSRRGTILLEERNKIGRNEFLLSNEQKKRIIKRQQQNPFVCLPSNNLDDEKILQDEDIPWYMLTTEQIIDNEKKKIEEESISLGSTSIRDDMSTISSTSSNISKKTNNSNKTEISKLSKKSNQSKNETSPNIYRTNPRLQKSRTIQKKKKKNLTADEIEKDISGKFLRINDLDRQIKEAEDEIRRLHAKQQRDSQKIKRVIEHNKRAENEIEGTREELSAIYDASLKILENTEAGREAHKAKMKQSAVEREAYRRSSLERELDSLRLAHRHYRADRETVKHAGSILLRYERMERLWEIAIEYAWKIGKEKVKQKRREALEEAKRREREKELVNETNVGTKEVRRASMQAGRRGSYL